jgi:hypothetical protein
MFRRAFREWKFCVYDIRQHYQQLKDDDCAACDSGIRSIHIDGNHKLWVYDRDFESWRDSGWYYEDVIFLADDKVLEHLEGLDLALPKQVSRTLCPSFN